MVAVNIEMPNACKDCPFMTECQTCLFKGYGEDAKCDPTTRRQSFCPLIEINK